MQMQLHAHTHTIFDKTNIKRGGNPPLFLLRDMGMMGGL